MSELTTHPETTTDEAQFLAPETERNAGPEHDDGEMIYVRLGDLVHSPLNVRQNDESDVTELADLIDSQSLLQNLIVVPHQTKRRKASSTKQFGVIAGGRRRRAMLLLVERGRLTLDYEVLCKRVTIEQAVQMSLAENSGREPLSAADTIMAFKTMVDEVGATVAETAICFGVSELTVERRLKLATVSPKLFNLFRAGQIEVGQLAALAVTDDHTAQERVWNDTPSYNRSAGYLRRLLLGNATDASRDPVAHFVGLPAYEAAGGVVKRDLFSEDGDGAILDPELLNRLAMAKLNETAERVGKEGWGWVEARPPMEYSERSRLSDAPKGQREAKPKEQERMDALRADQVAADEALEKLYDEDEPDQGKITELERASAKAGGELQKLRNKLRAWTPEVMAQAGAIVTIDSAGKQEILRGLVRPEDRKRVATVASREAAQARGESGADGGEQAPKSPAAATHSEALVRKLTAHRTKALQFALSQDSHVALASVVHVLLLQTVIRDSYQVDSALSIRASDCDAELTKAADDIESSRAWIELAGQLDNMREHIPGDTGALLRWLIGRPQDRLLELLAMCAALTVNTVVGRERDHAGDALVAALSLDMADWWTPTSTSYLNQVPKARIVEAVAEATDAETAAPLAKAKKGEAVAKAQDLIAGTRWLPTPLRPRAAD